MSDPLLAKIDAIERHDEPKKLAAGWTKSGDGHWVPPGYGSVAGWQPPAAPCEGGVGAAEESQGESDPHDSI